MSAERGSGGTREQVIAWLRERVEVHAYFASVGMDVPQNAALYRAALRDVEAMAALEEVQAIHRAVELAARAAPTEDRRTE